MRLLDLCCGEGLASLGYWQSGLFDEIWGVDIDPEALERYPFRKYRHDALKLKYDFLMRFDVIHASPPCQAYSKVTPDKSRHPRLIKHFHHMLYATGTPYIIENVEGSGQDLRPNLALNGTAVGLPIHRVRYFHISTLGRKTYKQTMNTGRNVVVHGGHLSRAELGAAMGVDPQQFTRHGMEQGIPPAMTRYIAQTFLAAGVGQ
jgi:DNA (cytosine-5)-methyltransferase 1